MKIKSRVHAQLIISFMRTEMAAGKLSLCGNRGSETELDGVRQSQNTGGFSPHCIQRVYLNFHFTTGKLHPKASLSCKEQTTLQILLDIVFAWEVPQYVSESHQVTLIYLYDLHGMILSFQVL